MTRQIRADLGWFALWAGLGALVLISFLELGVLGVAISFAAVGALLGLATIALVLLHPT